MVRSIVSFSSGEGSEVLDRLHVWVEVVVNYLPCSERFFSWFLKNKYFQIAVRSEVISQLVGDTKRFTGFLVVKKKFLTVFAANVFLSDRNKSQKNNCVIGSAMGHYQKYSL